MSLNSSSNSSHRAALDLSHSLRVCASISTTFIISFILLFIPLFIFVLYVGYQRWRKQRSAATTASTSHSDVFTFNMVVLEMISILGSCAFCYGAFMNRLTVMMVGMFIFSIISPGQTLFHLLTCVERYLAVIHPVTYLGLRQAGGVRIRNISIGCVWLLCFGSPGLAVLNEHFFAAYNFFLLIFSSVVVAFCSLSVLRILIRPGPGEVGGDSERVDQSKQRAFNTIRIIMGALLLRFLSHVVVSAVYSASVLSFSDMCLLMWSGVWFSLPSSLVLPLLFLQRAGKLPDCKHNSVSA